MYCYRDRNHCMRSIAFSGHDNIFTFIGDYRIRNMYETFQSHFTNIDEDSVRDKLVLDPFAEQPNLTFIDPVLKLKTDFVWTPYISKTVANLLNSWRVIIFRFSSSISVVLPKLLICSTFVIGVGRRA